MWYLCFLLRTYGFSDKRMIEPSFLWNEFYCVLVLIWKLITMPNFRITCILISLFQSGTLFGSSISQSDTISCHSCSLMTTAFKVKCSLENVSSNDSTVCNLIFEQANGDFDKPHTKCVGQNVFSTIGEYTGALRKIILHCKANHPLQLQFDGMLVSY